MTGVVLNEDELVKRPGVIGKLMKPLAKGGGGGMKTHQVASGSNGRLLCIGSGSGTGVPQSGSHRGVRYPSRIDRVTLNYSERWVQKARSAEYGMAHSNFHLDLIRSDGEEEILALHCEPALETGSLSSKYRKGPHLHLLLSGAARALSKSHISLCLTEAGQHCSSTADFTAALGMILRMIDDEVLPRLGPG